MTGHDPIIGAPPQSLNDAERACWNEIVALAPRDLCVYCDRLLIELAARMLTRIRANRYCKAEMFDAFAGLLDRLGMTPLSRSQMRADTPADDYRH